MAIRNIRLVGDDILRKKAKEVKVITPSIEKLLDDMAETMYNAEGVGLAAPQVGILKRIVVIDVGDGLIELINPEVIETSGCQVGEEGGLSIPGKSEIVERPNSVKVKAMDRKGNIFYVEGEGLKARALCHEIDHLDGILYIDKAKNTEEVY